MNILKTEKYLVGRAATTIGVFVIPLLYVMVQTIFERYIPKVRKKNKATL